jgi:hypothetical protein
MEHDWDVVAEEHFGLPGCTLVDEFRHQKQHYVLRRNGERYVLSTAPFCERRLPLIWQCRLVEALAAAGFWQARVPYPTVGGRPYATHGDRWWILHWYVLSDDEVDWSSIPLVEAAARTLADLHEAALRARSNLHLPAIDPGGLDPFHWSVPEVVDHLDELAARLDWELLSPADAGHLTEAIARLGAEADEVIPAAADHGLVGITHQDFRPSNLRVFKGRIRELLDWDLARIDHTLYDVAVACLQFMGRECLYPRAPTDPVPPVEPTAAFVHAYLAARTARHETRRTMAALLPWYIRYAIIKRILVGNSPRERLALLRQVDPSPLTDPAALIPSRREDGAAEPLPSTEAAG